jgi:hypothetical protein
LLVRWQNRYSYDTVGSVAGFRIMITEPIASMIKFWNPIVVPIV